MVPAVAAQEAAVGLVAAVVAPAPADRFQSFPRFRHKDPICLNATCDIVREVEFHEAVRTEHNDRIGDRRAQLAADGSLRRRCRSLKAVQFVLLHCE